MNLALTTSYALVVTLLIATPGPVVALVINTASAAGSKKALQTAIGANGASLALIVAAAAIISGAAVLQPETLRWISILGCLYIGWLAISAIREHAAGPNEAQQGRRLQQGGWLKGFLVGISNPKDILFFVALFPQFIQVTESFATSMGLLAAIWVALDLLILGAYIFVLGKVLSIRYRRWIALVSAVLLLGIAVAGLVYNLAT